MLISYRFSSAWAVLGSSVRMMLLTQSASWACKLLVVEWWVWWAAGEYGQGGCGRKGRSTTRGSKDGKCTQASKSRDAPPGGGYSSLRSGIPHFVPIKIRQSPHPHMILQKRLRLLHLPSDRTAFESEPAKAILR